MVAGNDLIEYLQYIFSIEACKIYAYSHLLDNLKISTIPLINRHNFLAITCISRDLNKTFTIFYLNNSLLENFVGHPSIKGGENVTTPTGEQHSIDP